MPIIIFTVERRSRRGVLLQSVFNSMKERLRLINGKLFIESHPRRGTPIHAGVALSPESDLVEAVS